MFIMPSFKKGLIVEQFQGNYLNPALNNPAMLVGSGRKYENRSKYKNKTQTAVINIVSYQKTAVFDHISLTLPSPPLPSL